MPSFGLLSDVEHVLRRPAMYSGYECGLAPAESLVLVGGVVAVATGELDRVALKCFDELLVNAADCASRGAATRIDVELGPDTVAVENDGGDVPLGFREEWGVHVPEALFGRLRSSCNYADERAGAGVNGIGCKFANIFSSRFVVRVRDAASTYTQTFRANMGEASAPAIEATGPHGPSVRVECTPDPARCTLTEATLGVCARRALDVALSYPGLRVTLDGEALVPDPRVAYAGLCDAGTMLELATAGYRVFVALAPEARTLSVVNGVFTADHGPHVAAVTRRLAEAAGAPEPAWRRFVAERLFLLVVARLRRPTFRGNEKSSLAPPLDPEPAAFGKAALRGSAVAAAWAQWLEDGAVATLQREERRRGKVRVDKLDDATAAGTADWRQCSLILTEGDSAKSFAVSGLAVVGRRHYGVFPLRGKVKNVRDASAVQADTNKELRSLKQILGLRSGVASAAQAPRYGRLLIMTDQDVDGFHIKGLILNFLDSQFPGLIGDRLQVDCLRTPLIKATSAGTVHEFFSTVEFAAFAAPVTAVKYYKGLGTSTAAEARAYFADLPKYTVRYGADGLGRLHELFAKESIGVRKQSVRSAMAACSPPPLERDADGYLRQDVGGFVDGELMLYTIDAIGRAIPSVVDGLKPSQRKVLWTLLQARGAREVKVAQLAAHVAHETSYHHGEASLQQTIVAMAQDFVGSNNVPLLEPIGQFGTRRLGGGDAASPRYIFTRLAAVARHLFPAADRALVPQLLEESQLVEPPYLLPVIPWVLVNGAAGIATGFSTRIPPHDPRLVCAHVRAALLGAAPPPALRMHVAGYTGAVGAEPSRYTTETTVTPGARGAHVVTELPVGVWTDAYKEHLQGLVDAKRATRFGNESTDVRVRFVVSGARAEDLRLVKYEGTRNMHALDADGVLRRWGSAEEIVGYYCAWRRGFYRARREALLAQASAGLAQRRAMERFVELVVGGGAAALFAAEDVAAFLEERGFERAEHDALLAAPVRSCTAERRRQLLAQIAALEAEHARLEETTETAMWLADLDALEAALP